MADYLTNMYDVMEAVKRAMLQYRASSASLQKIRTWSVGFILPRMVLPAVTVFPVVKRFGGRRIGGKQRVEYEVVVDIASATAPYVGESKAFVMEAMESIREALKGSFTMKDGQGKKHGYQTRLLSAEVAEDLRDKGKKFKSVGSFRLQVAAHHQMNEDRVNYADIYYEDSNAFFDRVVRVVERYTERTTGIRSWIFKVASNPVRWPNVVVLPGNEVEIEKYSGQTDIISRPISFNIVSKGFPKKEVLKKNIEIADALVIGIEKGYRVEGFALDAVVDSIEYRYSDIDENMQLFSSVLVSYECKKTFTRIKR